MRCQIDGVDVDARLVSYRGMGFGHRVDLPLHRYKVSVNAAAFFEKIERDYDRCVDELRDDYVTHGDIEPEYLFDLGYPDLEKLVSSNKAAAEELFADYLCFQVLGVLFPDEDEDPQNLRFIINSIEKVQIGESTITVEGGAFERTCAPQKSHPR